MTERKEMEAVVEAILFVSQDPVPRSKIASVFKESEAAAVEEAIEAVVRRYQDESWRGVMIDEVAGGLRLVSRPDLHGYLRRFFEVTGSNKLSMAALETMAIIAYRQPVTAPEIQELRNVNPSGVIKKLLERRLIRIAGRKEVVGKPFLYATTREFLMHFGLRSLKELPPLEQFEELFGGEEAPEEVAGPDEEEMIDQEAAEISAAESDAADEAEAAEIEAEREAAEEAEGFEEPLEEPQEESDDEEESDDPSDEEEEESDEEENSEKEDENEKSIEEDEESESEEEEK